MHHTHLKDTFMALKITKTHFYLENNFTIFFTKLIKTHL